MKLEILFSGVGGQGVITAGETLCEAANKAGMNVTFVPFYGQEKRGGRTMCNIVISDKRESPIISQADVMLIFDERSLREYQNMTAEDGTLILSSMIDAEPECKCKEAVKVPFYAMAQELGNSKAANVIALGYVAKLLPMIPAELIEEEIANSFAKKPQLIPMNKKAFRLGYEYQV